MKNLIMTILVAIIVSGSALSLSGLMNAPQVEADSIPADLQLVIIPPHIGKQVVVEPIKIELECPLNFYSYKEDKDVTPPDSFVQNVNKLDCRDQQILTRLAYYESNWNEDAINGWFKGYYQLGQGDTVNFCRDNGHYSSDEDCALFLYNWDKYNQFETVKVYPESFNL